MSLATLEQYNDAKIVLASVNDELYTPAQMQSFLDYASKYIESQCYRTLELATVTETLQLGSIYASMGPSGQLNVFLKQFPVVTISAFAYRYLPSADFTDIDTDLWSFTQDGDQITLPYQVPVSRYSWGQLRIAYSAGYPAGSVPDDLIMANISLAADMASYGYAAVTAQERNVRSILPASAFKMIDATIGRYKRQF